MEANDLLRALYDKGGFETVEASQPSQGLLRLMGRVRQDRVPDWILLINALLEAQGGGWTIDISKNYFRRAGRVVYAWRVLLQAEDVAPQLQSVIAVVHRAPRSNRGEVMEMPLLGASRNRNVMVKGKGAGPSGTVAVGPQLLIKGDF